MTTAVEIIEIRAAEKLELVRRLPRSYQEGLPHLRFPMPIGRSCKGLNVSGQSDGCDPTQTIPVPDTQAAGGFRVMVLCHVSLI